MKPEVFVGSSVESIRLAETVQRALEQEANITIWDQDIFRPSKPTPESLTAALDIADFAIFILAPDDVTKIRGEKYQTARDNVILELGMFMGRLGVERCFWVIPRGMPEFHFPTDLLGLTATTYDPVRLGENPDAALRTACARIWKEIERSTPGKGLKVKVFRNSAELYNYVAARLKKAEGTVDDVTYGHHRTSEENADAQVAYKRYLDAILEAASKPSLTYREVMSFPYIERVTRAEAMLKAEVFNYNLRYYPHYLPSSAKRVPPLISFIIIDYEEVILAHYKDSRRTQLLLSIKNTDIAHHFAGLYEEIWDGAVELKIGDNHREAWEKLQKIRAEVERREAKQKAT